MAALAENVQHMTEAEYLAFERASETRHEYLDGRVFDMVGASERHNHISTNTIISIGNQLRGRGCRVYANDMRVQVSKTGLFTYPDISLVCGEPQLADKQFDTLLNPVILIEILSPSTEAYDRGLKFQHYRQLDSLQEYLLISQDQPRIERFLRQPDDTWHFSDAAGLDASLELTSIGCTLPLAEVYEQVSFEEESREAE